MLFLQESNLDTVPEMEMEEAQAGLLECAMQMAALTEASYQADYTLSVAGRNGTLSEAVLQEKKEGLLAGVARRVKAALVKARDYIVGFFRSLGTRLKNLWARLVNMVKGRSKETIRISKSGANAVNEAMTQFEKVQVKVEQTVKTVESYKADVTKAIAAFDKWEEKVKNAVKAAKTAKSYEEVPVSALNKIQAVANKAAAVAGSAAARLKKEEQAAEKAEKVAIDASNKAKGDDKAAASKDALAEASKTLGEVRAVSAGYMDLTRCATSIGVVISAVVGARASETGYSDFVN